jgi:LAO/AO transport system kinase
VIVVETVGVGQSETAVASMVDFFLVLMLAGAGDELQGIKKGILELADAVAINKADGDNIEKAKKAARAYAAALHIITPASPVWSPPVLTCSAIQGTGMKTIWETILQHNKKMKNSGELKEKHQKQSVGWMWNLIEEGLKIRFHAHPLIKKQLNRTIDDVAAGKTAATTAAEDLLFLLDKHRPV